MEATALQEVRCRECGYPLASDHVEDGICSPCARKAPQTRQLPPERLVYVVGGLLLLWRGFKPQRRCHMRAELAKMGIDADHLDIAGAVNKLRRRGFAVDAEERRPGHLLTGLPRLKRNRGPQLRLFRLR